MKRLLAAGAALILVIAVAWWWAAGRGEKVQEEAYVREREVTAWNRLAQVREPAALLRYGERVGVLRRSDSKVRVRTAGGAEGWVDESQLMAMELWERGAKLLAEARGMPVQGHGRTKVATNLRAEPGRSGPRLYQFRAGVPVEIFARRVVELAASDAAPAKSGEPAEAKRDDWLFIRANVPEVGEMAGWVVGRFLEPELPEALRIYAAGIRFIAWFELNRVAPESGEQPHFLAVGVTGPEGQPCDFTLLRVYTWGAARRRYETAFLESNLCGRLPVRVELAGAEARISFKNAGRGGEEERRYAMRSTSVRRVTPRR
jgi:hypothetical protein